MDVWGNEYEVSYDGMERKNCYIADSGELVAVFSSPPFGLGMLKRAEYYKVADSAFADGEWNYGCTVETLIEITRGGGVREVAKSVDVMDGICFNETIVIAKGDSGYSAYELAVAGGFVGSVEEWILSLKQPALEARDLTLETNENVIISENIRVTAEDTRVASESVRVTAEELRVIAEDKREHDTQTVIDSSKSATVESVKAKDIALATEKSVRDGELLRVVAESERIVAEDGRVDAELVRRGSIVDALDQVSVAVVDAETATVNALNATSLTDTARVATVTVTQEANEVLGTINSKIASTVSVLPQTLTSEQQAQVHTNIDTKAIAEMAAKQLFIKQWDIACKHTSGENKGLYNQETGFFELNGIKDIELDEAITIYSMFPFSSIISIYCLSLFGGFRTLIPIAQSNDTIITFNSLGYTSKNILEVFYFNSNYPQFYSLTFAWSINLRKVTMLCSSGIDFKSGLVFRDCTKLSDLTIKTLKSNIDLHWSPLIKKLDIIYALTYRYNISTASIIFTLHSDVYAWASVDAEILALLPAGNYNNKEVGEVQLATL